MIKTAKRISALLVVLVTIMCCSSTAFAESTKKLTDDADILTGEEELALNEKIDSLVKKTGWDIIVYTNNNDVESYDMESYCNNYYDNHGYGLNSDKRGIFLTIDMTSREMYVITKGDTMYYISDERNDTMLDSIQMSLKASDNYGAVESFLDYTETYYDKGKPEDGTFSNVKLNEKADNPVLYVLKYYGVLIGIVSLGASALTVVFIKLRYKNNGKKGTYDLSKNNHTDITIKEDTFLYKNVSVTSTSSSSDGGGGSSGGGGGGGSSHGGGGRSF